MSAPPNRTPSLATTAANCVTLGVATGAAEIVVRFFSSHEPVPSGQLALGLIANAAVLGVASLGFGLIVHAVLYLAAACTSQYGTTLAARASGAAATAAFVAIVLATDTLGLADGLTMLTPVAAASTLFAAGATIRRPSASRTILSPRARVAMLLGWAGCVGVTLSAAASTRTDMQAWLQVDDKSVPPPGSPNVVVVVPDTLRFDRVGVYGDSNLTPNIDALAESSIVYTNALSTAPWTLPAHASLFTGLYPSAHGVNWGNFNLGDGPTTLAEIFRQQGYDTYAVSNNLLLNAENGFARGFDSFIELSMHPKVAKWRFALRSGILRILAGAIGIERFAGVDSGAAWTNWMLAQQIQRSHERKRPFFTFVNYYEVHDPYLPPSPYLEAILTPEQQRAAKHMVQSRDDLCAQACGVRGVLSKEEIKLLATLYDAEVAYQDAMIGRLVAILRQAEEFDNTWFVILSDHGELFGEAGMVFHTAGWHYQLLHVPLIVHPPGGTTQTRVDAPVQPVDLFATLVNVAGAPMPQGVHHAVPLPWRPSDTSRRRVCFAETHGASLGGLWTAQNRSMRTDLSHWLKWVTSVYTDGYLLEIEGENPASLYHVAVDPNAEHNLIGKRADLVRSLMDEYHQFRNRNLPGDN